MFSARRSASSTKAPLVILATSTNSFPTEGAKVGLLVDSTEEESNKDGAEEAGTGGWEARGTIGIPKDE